jgi:hypothetical protein
MHWLQTAHHNGPEKYISNLCPQPGETARIRLRIEEDAPVQPSLGCCILPDLSRPFCERRSVQRSAPDEYNYRGIRLDRAAPTLAYLAGEAASIREY